MKFVAWFTPKSNEGNLHEVQYEPNCSFQKKLIMQTLYMTYTTDIDHCNILVYLGLYLKYVLIW
jgi:hypothetical protein